MSFFILLVSFFLLHLAPSTNRLPYDALRMNQSLCTKWP